MTTARANEALPLLRRGAPSAPARTTRASLVALVIAIAAVLAAVAVAGGSFRFLASASAGSLENPKPLENLGDAVPDRSLHVGPRGRSRFHAARLGQGEDDANPKMVEPEADENANTSEDSKLGGSQSNSRSNFRAHNLEPSRLDPPSMSSVANETAALGCCSFFSDVVGYVSDPESAAEDAGNLAGDGFNSAVGAVEDAGNLAVGAAAVGGVNFCMIKGRQPRAQQRQWQQNWRRLDLNLPRGR